MQAALWHFTTGKGGARRTHQTVFAYAINVYPSRKDAKAAVANLKIKTTPYRVSKIYSRLYRSSDGKQTLVFLFFSYRGIEVESYYEYKGTAPASVATSLRALFLRQNRHLAAAARKLHKSINHPPPPPRSTATPEPLATATVAASDTPTPTLSATPQATATATAVPPTATPYPSSTPTDTPVPILAVTAAPTNPTFAPNTLATVTARVTLGGNPVAGAEVGMTFEFPGAPAFCNAVTDASGNVSCGEIVPAAATHNAVVTVYITARDPSGGEIDGTATFTVT